MIQIKAALTYLSVRHQQSKSHTSAEMCGDNTWGEKKKKKKVNSVIAPVIAKEEDSLYFSNAFFHKLGLNKLI